MKTKRSRRQHGEGSISRYRRKDGYQTWKVQVTRDGKQRTIGYRKVASEARELLHQAIRARDEGVELPRRRQARVVEVTVGQAVESYLGKRLRGELEPIGPTTYAKHAGTMRQCLGSVADRPLAQLKRDEVEALCGRLRRRGLSDTTINMAVRLLKMVLVDAAGRGLVRDNPLAGMRRSRKEAGGKGQALSLDRMLAVLDRVRDNELLSLWSLALLAGLRAGELAGLRWREVYLDVAIPHVVVVQSVARISGTYAAEMREAGYEVGRQVKATKTAHSVRKVALVGETVAALRTRRDRLQPRPEDHVFTTARGGLITPRWIGPRWHDLQTEAGIVEHVRPHDMRHTMATLEAGAGQPALTAARLGHVPAGQTAQYQHPPLEHQVAIVRYLEGQLEDARRRARP